MENKAAKLLLELLSDDGSGPIGMWLDDVVEGLGQ